ncbi:MAG: response regulator transcription factor [Eubacteriales bacterium]|nr:response regulator transcription factor [Eubacteriales bacterium]
MANMLIAEDNKQMNLILQDYAKKEGFEVFSAYNGKEALEIFKNQHIDIILLDVMMPILDGFEVCRQIRKESMVPIIMTTARSEDYDKIMGLDLGADDYVVKPFSPNEVMARVRAVFRRMPKPQENYLSIGNIKINSDERLALIDDKNIKLTKKEFDLLELFANNINRIYSRDKLLDMLWGWDYEGDARTVDTHVTRLRNKLKDANVKGFSIDTVWAVGYKGVKDDTQ